MINENKDIQLYCKHCGWELEKNAVCASSCPVCSHGLYWRVFKKEDESDWTRDIDNRWAAEKYGMHFYIVPCDAEDVWKLFITKAGERGVLCSYVPPEFETLEEAKNYCENKPWQVALEPGQVYQYFCSKCNWRAKRGASANLACPECKTGVYCRAVSKYVRGDEFEYLDDYFSNKPFSVENMERLLDEAKHWGGSLFPYDLNVARRRIQLKYSDKVMLWDNTIKKHYEEDIEDIKGNRRCGKCGWRKGQHLDYNFICPDCGADLYNAVKTLTFAESVAKRPEIFNKEYDRLKWENEQYAKAMERHRNEYSESFERMVRLDPFKALLLIEETVWLRKEVDKVRYTTELKEQLSKLTDMNKNLSKALEQVTTALEQYADDKNWMWHTEIESFLHKAGPKLAKQVLGLEQV